MASAPGLDEVGRTLALYILTQSLCETIITQSIQSTSNTTRKQVVFHIHFRRKMRHPSVYVSVCFIDFCIFFI
jgi:hypothetical protein